MTLYSIIGIIATIAAGIPTFFHSPYSYRKKYGKDNKLLIFYHKKWVKTTYFAFFVFVILICSDLNDSQSRDLIFAEQHEADSIIAAKINDSKNEVTEVLGKYGFMLDTTNQLLVKIRDKPIAVVTPIPNPYLDFDVVLDSVGEKNIYYTFKIECREAKTTIQNLNVALAVETKGKFQLVDKSIVKISNIPMSKDNTRISRNTLTVGDVISKIGLLVTGSHISDRGKKKSIRQFLILNLEAKVGGIATDEMRRKMEPVF